MVGVNATPRLPWRAGWRGRLLRRNSPSAHLFDQCWCQSPARPVWEARVRFWLTDGQYRPNGDGSDWHYTWHGWIEDAGKWLLCRAFGHLPIADQCGKPEHDYCACCMRSTPRQPA